MLRMALTDVTLFNSFLSFGGGRGKRKGGDAGMAAIAENILTRGTLIA